MNITNTLTTYHIPTIQADPFEDWDQFDIEHAAHYNAIQGLLAASTAISFQTGNNTIMFHPSTKQEGYFQVTVFINGIPFSDSQHETKQEAAQRIVEYDYLEVLEVI